MKRRCLLGGGLAVGASLVAGRAGAAEPRAAAPVGVGSQPSAVALAIEHARVHTGDGRRIDDGTVVFQGDRLIGVGTATQASVPPNARRIDGRGCWITPGLFDAESQTGLVDVHLEPSGTDTGLDDRYDAVRAAFRVIDGWNPRAVVVPITRLEGVTTAALAPHRGFVAGQGAVVRLGAASPVVRTPSAVYVSFAGEGRVAAFGARGGAFLRFRELLDDVRTYARRRQDFERNDMRRLSASRLDLEALIPVVEGSLPLVVEAHRASDIEAVLRLAAQERLRVLLSGAEEAHLVASTIAAAKVAVILTPTSDLPRSFESLGARLENAARLHAAGVEVLISPREREDHSARTLRFEAGNAVAHGLPWEAALAAVTSHPARAFGLGDRMGVLDVGRAADLVMWTGDPFEPLTRARAVFVAGVEMPMRSRQTELRDRYRGQRR